jgi:hypothetical protein
MDEMILLIAVFIERENFMDEKREIRLKGLFKLFGGITILFSYIYDKGLGILPRATLSR